MYNRIMTNDYIKEWQNYKYNNDPNFREEKLENNKKYYYSKKYKITQENVLTRIYFN